MKLCRLARAGAALEWSPCELTKRTVSPLARRHRTYVLHRQPSGLGVEQAASRAAYSFLQYLICGIQSNNNGWGRQ